MNLPDWNVQRKKTRQRNQVNHIPTINAKGRIYRYDKMTLQQRRGPPRPPQLPKSSILATMHTERAELKSPSHQQQQLDTSRLPPKNRRRNIGCTTADGTSNSRRSSISFPALFALKNPFAEFSNRTRLRKQHQQHEKDTGLLIDHDPTNNDISNNENSKTNIRSSSFWFVPTMKSSFFNRKRKRNPKRAFRMLCMIVIANTLVLWSDIPWFQPQYHGHFPLALKRHKFPYIRQILHGNGLKYVHDNIDISWLLQFAVVGFPKSGTSTMMEYLNFAFGDDKIRISQREECFLRNDSHVHRTVKQLYSDAYPGGEFIQGLKCPRHVEEPTALRNYQRFFPQTSFIVGVRHPVLWFESFYNFRINNEWEMEPSSLLTNLVGSCSIPLLCTDRGAFHIYLAQLGKTNLSTTSSDEERSLFPPSIFKNHSGQEEVSPPPFTLQTFGPSDRKIFLYDVEQLKDTNETRNEQFRNDLGQFLGVLDSDDFQSRTLSSTSPSLKVEEKVYTNGHTHTQNNVSKSRLLHSLPPLIHVSPGIKHNNTMYQSWLDSQKIDICDDIPSFYKVRQVLLQHGRNASIWIRNYFLQSSDVHVSSQSYLEVLLESWSIDPCLHRNATKYSIKYKDKGNLFMNKTKQ